MNNKTGNKLKWGRNDNIYTPSTVAKLMIDMCDIKPNHQVLDPCKGGGVFFNNLPDYCDKDYCEITEHKDFFKCENKYDWIIGNPPFSLWDKWIEHTMKITDKFCYIMNTLNLTDKRMRSIMSNGYGLTKMHLLDIDWWFGRTFICVFEKDKPSIISVSPCPVLCDICGVKCKRGRLGNCPNTCTNQH